jgi:prepilin-type N-terminal cleavage/methylation domain-containing protein
MHKKKSAFSLIELSVVLIVIGILVTGVSQGYAIVRSAKISNARSITAKSSISQTPGLIAWYEPTMKESFLTSQSYNNAQITEWRDISPYSLINQTNKLTTTASSNIIYQNNTIGDLPSVYFGGGSQRFTLSSFAQGSNTISTIFIVFRANYNPDTTNYKQLIDGVSNTYYVAIKADSFQLNAGTPSNSTAVSNSIAYQTPEIAGIYFNRNNSEIYLNNTDSNLGGAKFNPGSNQLTSLTVGATNSGAQGFIGNISEIIIFNRPIKAMERKEIFSYLAKKYKTEVTGI